MEDVSKEVVAVILVIAIVISVLGTWLVLDSATSVKTNNNVPSSAQLDGDSNINVEIIEKPTGDSTGGNIQLRLTN